MKKIKVLIADDSAFMRKLLADIIASDDELEVVALARNGEDALRQIASHKPDVVTLDVEMPVMDGLTALEKIMAEHPLPVVMLSAFTDKGTASTLKALEKGAVDFVTKPGGTISPGTAAMSSEIISKLKMAARISRKNIRITSAPLDLAAPPVKKIALPEKTERVRSLVAIGTSTGGPKALHEVMRRFSHHHNAALLIVQHMPPGFTKSLAQRLDTASVYTVKEAEDGDEVKGGCAYLAPGDYHMEINEEKGQLTIKLNQSSQVNGHRPSVDVLLKSAARTTAPKVGVIMTGMGSDGAIGMKMMKDAGAINIGESEETCVIYSMPKAAKQLGALDYETPLYRIAEVIEKVVSK
ncbi:MAG: chemotaxis response regulator protein-glutamate methylesterase [Clostridia bacterium]|nr:chemotaxis response regulator protein-glutamate methylesterase [Clostridia bacterium]